MAFAGHHVDFASGDESVRAYVSVPAAGRGPGVVVLPEWWGLVDHVREVCDRLAREGFVAFAPDLYRGDTTTDPDAASRLMMDLEIPRAGRDLDGAIAATLGHDAVEGSHVGVIGFCMGGQLALYAGTKNDRVRAVVDFYGVHPNVQLDFAGMQAAVLGLFAENDAFVPPDVARQLDADLQAAGVSVATEIFPGVDHAFMNDHRPEVYDAETATRAWGLTLAFLRKELG